MQRNNLIFIRIPILALSAYLLIFSSVEFWNITWGTGKWLGQFSFKWALAFLVFIIFCIFCLTVVFAVLWRYEGIARSLEQISSLRNRLGWLRLLPAIAFLMAPVWILQYTAWGVILHGALRILLWLVSTILAGVFLTQTKEKLLTWHGILASLTLMSGTLIFVSSLRSVTSYPFSLGWSEGNRLWDYSVLFGRDLYDYPSDRQISVLLDIGRQFVGGIPFLIPGVTIWQARLWNGLVNVVPYLILGLIAFKLSSGDRRYWMLAGIWAMIFVIQGPIHPPLLLCAIFVAFAWRKPLWLAIPLIIVTSYFAEVSRFTWLFAPGIWAGMLELSGAITQDNRLSKTAWVRALSVGTAGIIGGYLAPFFVPSLISRTISLFGQAGTEIVANLGTGVTLSAVGSESSAQPLLWYRLFPNATYGYGILLGLFLATAPLIAVLLYLSSTRRWNLNIWQKIAILLPLLAFLVVGLIVSVKIGGGGDLHNMDMFLIGLMFAGTIAWHNGGYEWIRQVDVSPAWLRVVTMLLMIIPIHQLLIHMTPISTRTDMLRIMTLADIPPLGPMPEVLPSKPDTMEALEDIRHEVEQASSRGDILFMDQRQLLTFGYIKGIALVPEYDKKVLINQAMSSDAGYFKNFYQDLAAHRFSLIISNPLHERIQTTTDDFGEENNAWVKWVSTPVLCYYEPLYTLKKVNVQLLVPRQDVSNCDQSLPVNIH
jgi:hypothetical protein